MRIAPATAVSGILLCAAIAWRAQAAAAPEGLPDQTPHRFDEDWRAYCAQAVRPPALWRAKCLSLGDSVLLSLGADGRVRLEVADQPGFGLEQSNERIVLHRAMAHADLRAGRHVRAFAQLGSFFASGRDRPRPTTDEDRFDLIQGFLDLETDSSLGRFTLRGGRQELSFGASRLVGVREGANVRRVFLGGRGIFEGAGGARIDVFHARPVELDSGVFDDESADDERLQGVYGTWPVGGPISIDGYWLGFERDHATFASIEGRERRHSLGLRVFGETERFDWDVEAVAQLGEVGDRNIRAWTIASDLGVRREDWPAKPRLSLKADVASGDRSGSDGTLGTFNALYPRFPYFSEAILVVPANVVDLHLSLEVRPIGCLTLELGWNPVWRHDVSDAVYAAPLEPIAGTAGEGGRFTTHQTLFGFEWTVARGLTLTGQYVHAVPGRALRDVGGETVDFGTVSLAVRY